MALHVDSGEHIVPEGEGSAELGELMALWGVVMRGTGRMEPVHIYTDSCAVSRGARSGSPFGSNISGK